MQTQPKISIITPSLNQGRFIEETILSVLSQGYENLEYIIVDGLSTDETLSILEKYSDKLRWISEKDTGQTNAINKGLAMAKGEIVGYLNADDILLPNALLNVADMFVKQPQVMWVIGQCNITDENGNEVRSFITLYKNLMLRFRSFPLLCITNFISQPATLWRRSIVDSLGFLDENLNYVMDYEFWLRIYAKYRPLFMESYLASFRVHPNSKTSAVGHKEEYIAEERAIIQRHTNSKTLLFFHKIHRSIMTFIYSQINHQ